MELIKDSPMARRLVSIVDEDDGLEEYMIAIVDANPTWQLREINNHPSYHGAMEGNESQMELKHHSESCYLTRYSERRNVYVLSVMKVSGGTRVFQHFTIDIRNRNNDISYEIKGADMKFKHLSDMLKFYQCNPVSHSVSNIGECVMAYDYYESPQPVANCDSKNDDADDYHDFLVDGMHFCHYRRLH